MDYSAFTSSVIDSIGPAASPRMKEIMSSLISSLHSTIIETRVTTEEWKAACDFLREAGRVEKQNEIILISDILGIESLVDMLDHESDMGENATESSVLGPFYKEDVPVQENSTSILRKLEPNGVSLHLFGVVRDADGTAIPGVSIDVWQDDADGFYDVHSGIENHCRGRFETDESGYYSVITILPTAYPIPIDFSAGKLLKLLDRNCYRTAHIHLLVKAKGYKPLVTQIFDQDCKFRNADTVFAVKDSLVVEFKSGISGKFERECQFDITLVAL